MASSKKNKIIEGLTKTRKLDGKAEVKDIIVDKNAHKGGKKHEAVVDKAKLAMVKESYKAIRTNIILSVVKEGCKKIVIAGDVAGVGKTTTAANLATSLAQTDKRVLLIDADLRKPNIYDTMNFANNPGLTNILTGLSTFEEVVNETAYPNLQVICAGILVPNPAELLACGEMVQFIEMIEEKYDYILFDTPPINVVADALPLIQISDGAVMVVRQNYSTYPNIDNAMQRIKLINGKVLGFIFNDVTEETNSKYAKYYH